MFYAALLFAGGVVLAQRQSVSSPDWLLLIGVLLLSAIIGVAHQLRSSILIATLAFLPLGGLCAQWADKAQAVPPDISAYTLETMEITAHVSATALPRAGADGVLLQSVEVETETISEGSEPHSLTVGTRLTLHENGKPLPQLHYGDRIRFVAKLR